MKIKGSALFKNELILYLVKRRILKEKNLVFDQIDKQHIRCFNGKVRNQKIRIPEKILQLLDNEEIEVKI